MSCAFRGHQAPQSINCLVIGCSQKKGFLVSFMIMWCKFFPTQMCLMNITPSWIISPPRLIFLIAAHDHWRHHLFPEPCTPDSPVRCQHTDSMRPPPSPPPLQGKKKKKSEHFKADPFTGAKCFPQLLSQQPRALNLPVCLHHVSIRSKIFLEAPVYFLRETLVTFMELNAMYSRFHHSILKAGLWIMVIQNRFPWGWGDIQIFRGKLHQ